MLIIYFLFLTLKTCKFSEGGVINSNGLKYDPSPYLNSKGGSKDVSTAKIISQEPFIISLGIQDKEIEPNRSRTRIPTKKRNRTKRETEETLKRSKRCHHKPEKYGQRKRDLRPWTKKPEPANNSAPDPEIVTSEFHPPDTYEVKPNSTTQCVIKIADDQYLDDLIEEIQTLKEKLKDLLILVANFTSSDAEVPSGNEARTSTEDLGKNAAGTGSETKKSTEDLEDNEDEAETAGSESQTEGKELGEPQNEKSLTETVEDLPDSRDGSENEETISTEDLGKNANGTESETKKSTEDLQDNEDEVEAGSGNQKSSTELGGTQNKNEESSAEAVDDEDLPDSSEDKLKEKINLSNETNEIPTIVYSSNETDGIPDDIMRKWKDSPLLQLLDAPEEIPYEYKLLDDSKTEGSNDYEAQKFLQNKIKYLQDILDSDDLKSRKKRDAPASPAENRKKRCARDRVSSSHTKERFKSRQWEDELKSKRAQSQCSCSGCRRDKSEEADSFEVSDEYVENFLDDNPEKLLRWSKKSADSDPFVDDLEVYRDKAKKILKNAQEILKRIKETEEKMKPYDDYLEADWGRHESDRKTNNDDDVEDLVYELIKKVGKRLQAKKRRLEGESVSFEFESAERSGSAENSDEDDENVSENLEAVKKSETSDSTTVSPSTLKGTDVMKDHRDQSLEAKEAEEISLPDDLPLENDETLQASKLGLNSTDSVEKLMDDFQDGKLDEKDMKTIQDMDGGKIDTVIDQIEEREGEEEGCTEPVNECEQTCPCADKTDDVDKYEIMKSFLLWIKEMHLYNTLDHYPKIKSAYD